MRNEWIYSEERIWLIFMWEKTWKIMFIILEANCPSIPCVIHERCHVRVGQCVLQALGMPISRPLVCWPVASRHTCALMLQFHEWIFMSCVVLASIWFFFLTRFNFFIEKWLVVGYSNELVIICMRWRKLQRTWRNSIIDNLEAFCHLNELSENQAHRVHFTWFKRM